MTRYLPYSINHTISANDRGAIKAQLRENPSMWPSLLAAQWGLSESMAKLYIQKAQEAAGYSSKSVL